MKDNDQTRNNLRMPFLLIVCSALGTVLSSPQNSSSTGMWTGFLCFGYLNLYWSRVVVNYYQYTDKNSDKQIYLKDDIEH